MSDERIETLKRADWVNMIGPEYASEVYELIAALEHAERALAAENLKGYDEGFRIAEQMTAREVCDLRTLLADMIDVADRCAWYVVRATSTTPYDARIQAARTALTPGALSAPPPGAREGA